MPIVNLQGTCASTSATTFFGNMSSFEATPDLLLLGVRISRKQGDRLGEERFARRLRMDFPASDQARDLAELTHNPG